MIKDEIATETISDWISIRKC